MTINFVTFHTCYETGGLFSLVFLNVQSEIQPLCGVYGTHTNIIPQLSDILLLCMMIVVWAPSRGLSSRVYNSRVLTTKPLRNGSFKFVYNCSQQNGLKLQKKIYGIAEIPSGGGVGIMNYFGNFIGMLIPWHKNKIRNS